MTRNVKKNLIGLEDLTLGTGTVVQDRAGKSVTLNKVDMVRYRSTIEEVTALTPASVADGQVFCISSGAGEGKWKATKADISTEVANDPLGGLYRSWDGANGSTGGLIRFDYGKAVKLEFFGGGIGGDDTRPFEEAAKLGLVKGVFGKVYRVLNPSINTSLTLIGSGFTIDGGVTDYSAVTNPFVSSINFETGASRIRILGGKFQNFGNVFNLYGIAGEVELFELGDGVEVTTSYGVVNTSSDGVDSSNETIWFSRLVLGNITARDCQNGLRFSCRVESASVSEHFYIDGLNASTVIGTKCRTVGLAIGVGRTSQETYDASGNYSIAGFVIKNIQRSAGGIVDNDYCNGMSLEGKNITIGHGVVKSLATSNDGECEGVYFKARNLVISSLALEDAGTTEGFFTVKGFPIGYAPIPYQITNNVVIGNIVLVNTRADVVCNGGLFTGMNGTIKNIRMYGMTGDGVIVDGDSTGQVLFGSLEIEGIHYLAPMDTPAGAGKTERSVLAIQESWNSLRVKTVYADMRGVNFDNTQTFFGVRLLNPLTTVAAGDHCIDDVVIDIRDSITSHGSGRAYAILCQARTEVESLTVKNCRLLSNGSWPTEDSLNIQHNSADGRYNSLVLDNIDVTAFNNSANSIGLAVTGGLGFPLKFEVQRVPGLNVAEGQAVIANGTNTITVAHGLKYFSSFPAPLIPRQAITATIDGVGGQYSAAISSVNSTSIVLKTAAAVTADSTVGWRIDRRYFNA